jgi:hypothetical protein
MISLTDEQLRCVMDLATPVPIEQRDEFLRALAVELRLRGDVGPGELHRLCVEVRHRLVPWVTTMAANLRQDAHGGGGRRLNGPLLRRRPIVPVPGRAQGRPFVVACDARRPRRSAALDERAVSAARANHFPRYGDDSDELGPFPWPSWRSTWLCPSIAARSSAFARSSRCSAAVSNSAAGRSLAIKVSQATIACRRFCCAALTSVRASEISSILGFIVRLTAFASSH